MVSIRLAGLHVEFEKKKSIKDYFKRGRWYKVVALDLVSDDNPVAEWFYLVAASPLYIENPDRGGPLLDEKYTVVQDKFDLKALEKVANDRMSHLHAEDMDGFYDQMSQYFLHDE